MQAIQQDITGNRSSSMNGRRGLEGDIGDHSSCGVRVSSQYGDPSVHVWQIVASNVEVKNLNNFSNL